MSAPVETMALTTPDSMRSQKTSPILPTVKAPDNVITDRKSTRLNSSHSQISYAVFCLKKKKKLLDAIKESKAPDFTHFFKPCVWLIAADAEITAARLPRVTDRRVEVGGQMPRTRQTED